MLWLIFAATGEFKPVKAIADFLRWRDDYLSSRKRAMPGRNRPKASVETTAWLKEELRALSTNSAFDMSN